MSVASRVSATVLGSVVVVALAAAPAFAHSEFRPADDEEYRQTYLARVRGEVDDDTWIGFLRSRKSASPT
jgi:hypothetical protein